MRHFRVALVALATVTCASGLLATVPSEVAYASGTPITIALVTSLTGPAAPEFSTSPAAFKARIALQNAEGGVNGHKLVPLVVDDQTTQTTSAVQDAISKGAFGIVSDSSLFFSAAKYPQQQGIPVTGGDFDGPEWGEQPYTNMFSSDDGSLNPKYPVNLNVAHFMKQHGGTILGTYGYSVSPSSARAAVGTAEAFEHYGGKVGVLNTSVPFGGVDFTADALVAKQKGVNAIFPSTDNDSNFALVTAFKQAGIKPKVVVLPTGYDPTTVGSPAWQDLQGDYFLSQFRPFSAPNAGTEQMQQAMEKYAHWSATQFPNYSQYEAWLGADLMIKGLELAGKSPTRSSVIKELRDLKSYNGNGLLPITFNYSTIFGHDPSVSCSWFLKATQSGFSLASATPTCGAYVPGTSTASS